MTDKLNPKWYPEGKVPERGNGYEYDNERAPLSEAAEKQVDELERHVFGDKDSEDAEDTA